MYEQYPRGSAGAGWEDEKAARRRRRLELTRETVRNIMCLGYANNAAEEAEQFVLDLKSVADFRAHLQRTKGHVVEPSAIPSETQREMVEDMGRWGYSIARLIRSAAMPKQHGGDAALEMEVSAELKREAIDAGRDIRGHLVPWAVLARDLTVGTTPAGGFLKGTDHLGGAFIDALRPVSAVIALGATVLQGLRGDVAIPALNAKTTVYWVAENNAPTEGAPTFRQVTLAPKTVAAYIDLSRKLMVQSAPAVDRLLTADLRAQIATAIDAAAIKGGGANEPVGILSTSGIGDFSLASDGAAPTWAMVVGLTEDVEVADAVAAKPGYLTNAKVKSKLGRTVKVASTDSKMIHEGGDVLFGAPFKVSNNVPSNLTKGAGANLSAMIFGSWDQLLVGSWGSGVDILVDPFSLSSTGATRLTAFADVDVALRHVGAFTAAQDIVTT